MTIKNEVTNKYYIQWIEKFVKDVLRKARIKCNEVTILDIEEDRRVFIEVDNQEYTIRTWSFTPIAYDKNDNVCSEYVTYTLFKIVENCGEEICVGRIKISWDNDLITEE